MSKYIDADKLIAEIEKRLKNVRDYMNGAGMTYKGPKYLKAQGKESAYDALLSIINSLQQEQPEGLHFIPLIRLIQKIPSKNWNNTVNNYAKKLRDCLIKEGYLKDAKVLQDYISYMNGNNVPMATMDEQEQPDNEDIDKVAQELYEHLYELKRRNNVPTNLYDKQEIIDLWKAGIEYGRNHPNQEQPDNMIQWTGNNLKEVIDFTGKSPRFEEWFKSWEEYENYVHTHNDILKLFCEDGSHYEVPVGAWIVKTPDGYNVPSVARLIPKEKEDHLF